MSLQSSVTLELPRYENVVFGREALLVLRDAPILGRGPVDIPIEGRLLDWHLLLINKFGRCQAVPLWDSNSSRFGIAIDQINRQGYYELSDGEVISFDPDCNWQIRKISELSVALYATHNSAAVIRANGVALRRAVLLQDVVLLGGPTGVLSGIDVPCEIEIRRHSCGLTLTSQQAALELAIGRTNGKPTHIDLVCRFSDIDFRLLMKRLAEKNPIETRHRIAYLNHCPRPLRDDRQETHSSQSEPIGVEEERVSAATLF